MCRGCAGGRGWGGAGARPHQPAQAHGRASAQAHEAPLDQHQVSPSAACRPYPAAYDHAQVAQSPGAVRASRRRRRYDGSSRSSSHLLKSAPTAQLRALDQVGSAAGWPRKRERILRRVAAAQRARRSPARAHGSPPVPTPLSGKLARPGGCGLAPPSRRPEAAERARPSRNTRPPVQATVRPPHQHSNQAAKERPGQPSSILEQP